MTGGGRRGMDGPGGPRRGDSMDKGDNCRERSPLDDRGRDRDRYESFSAKSDRERERERDRDRDRDRDRGFYGRDSGFKKDGPFAGADNFRGSMSSRDDRAFGSQPYRPSLTEPRGKDFPPVSQMDRTNDCEIIVVSKNQREYAEYIEHRLKQLGLTVDLLFPNEEVPIGRVLANISGRGSLYAIVVMPQNEVHRSLTLNILHGLPQEHRNMPLEDAVPLIMRNFEAYMRGEKMPTTIPTPISVVSSSVPLTDRHPEAIQVLLNLLSDNRQLTVLQYDRVIRYLQDKREMQIQLELGDAKDLAPVKTTQEPANKQQVDLQHRILNILNNTSNTGMPNAALPTVVPAPVAPVPAPVAPAGGSWPLGSQSGTGPTPLLNDPTVQKALDSLIQGDLLRKISSSATPATTAASSLGTPPSQPLFGAFAGGSGRRF
ncbi:nuclear receptor coactivator 5-like isoform X2 [Periplaneta americana]